MSSKSDVFIRESVLVFGFFGGLFARIGVDPETELIKGLLKIVEAFIPSIVTFNPWILILIIASLTIIGIAAAFFLGGILGLMSVGCAWVGGFILIGDSIQSLIGIFLLFVAIFVGLYATEKT